VSQTKHRLRRARALSQSPSQGETRRKVAQTAYIGLSLIAQSQTQRDIGLQSPIVLQKGRGIDLTQGGEWSTGGNRILKRAAAQSPDLLHAQARGKTLKREPVSVERRECESTVVIGS